MNSIEEIVRELDLKPHPEGGFYKETYRCKEEIPQSELGEAYNGSRNYSTAIYFLLTSDTFSAFHRIIQDEFWFFHQGSPIGLHTISPDGVHDEHIIGNDLANEQIPQLVVKGGDWFAAEVVNENDFALVSCTVSPGFDFSDFELPTRNKLLDLFPDHKEVITKLTRQ